MYCSPQSPNLWCSGAPLMISQHSGLTRNMYIIFTKLLQYIIEEPNLNRRINEMVSHLIGAFLRDLHVTLPALVDKALPCHTAS
jgi:hypothetical protein